MKSIEILRALKTSYSLFHLPIRHLFDEKKQPKKIALSYHLFSAKEKTQGESYLVLVVDTSHRTLLNATNNT
jgi:hypothetical protein